MLEVKMFHKKRLVHSRKFVKSDDFLIFFEFFAVSDFHFTRKNAIIQKTQ